jgi:hypothetical protein
MMRLMMQTVQGKSLKSLTRFAEQFSSFRIVVFAVLVSAVVALIGLASRENVAASSVSLATFAGSGSIFRDLKPCDVPGLSERVLAKGKMTVVFAGEFRPVTTIPWVSGSTRISMYIVSGLGVVRVGDKTQAIAAGDFFVIPKYAKHAVSAMSGPLRAIYFEDRS